MVGANTFRDPALTAKMATTLDHISGGRAILGIGGAWFEHGARGIRARVRGAASRNGCAGSARRCRSCAGCSTASARRRPARTTARRRSATTRRRSRQRLPILIGGGGEQVTLKLVARYGDANNVGGGIENVKRKEAILLQHCETVGRDPAEIERTTGSGTRDHPRLARGGGARPRRRSSSATATPTSGPTSRSGTPEDVVERLAPFVELGYRHLIAGFPSPHDEESMTRLATEVRPMLKGG